jgi:hypothetical protein
MSLGPTLRLERLLKVLRVNTRFGSLRPSHLRPIRVVHLYELSLAWASGKGEEPRALSDAEACRLPRSPVGGSDTSFGLSAPILEVALPDKGANVIERND